jgi:hypothetical protein
MTSPTALGNKVWNYAHVLRDPATRNGARRASGSEPFGTTSWSHATRRTSRSMAQGREPGGRDGLPAPAVLAAEIIEDLEAALEQFREVATALAPEAAREVE